MIGKFQELVLNKGGRGGGVPKLPKMCVFGLKNRLFFWQTLTMRFLNVSRGGGVLLIQERFIKCTNFFTPPNADIVDEGVNNDVDRIGYGASDNMCAMISCS